MRVIGLDFSPTTRQPLMYILGALGQRRGEVKPASTERVEVMARRFADMGVKFSPRLDRAEPTTSIFD